MSLFDAVQNLIFKDGSNKGKSQADDTDSEIIKTAKRTA